MDPKSVEGRRFDLVAYTHDLYAAAPRRLAFQAKTRKQAEAWQQKLAELVGGFPSTHVPLHPAVLGARDFGTYRREKVVFDSRPGTSVIAYVLLPKSAPAPAPVMICVPGHGRGVDDIVGIDDQGNDRTTKAGYQHDFAIQVAEAGLAAVAIEPLAFGCRRDSITAKAGLGRSACQPSAGGALLVGQTMIAWRVYEDLEGDAAPAGAPYFPLYHLRHTFATRLSAGGVADHFVTQMLRQGDSTMFKRYSQAKLNMMREALTKLDRHANEQEAILTRPSRTERVLAQFRHI